MGTPVGTHRRDRQSGATVEEQNIWLPRIASSELKSIKTRLVLSNAEKATLAEIGRRLGHKALEEIAVAAKPDTILGWFRKLVARKIDGSKSRRACGAWPPKSGVPINPS